MQMDACKTCYLVVDVCKKCSKLLATEFQIPGFVVYVVYVCFSALRISVLV